MSLQKYITKLLKDALLQMSLKPSAEPPTKRTKRGPGRLRKRKICEPQVVTIVSGSESDKENKPDNATGSCETAKVKVEKDSAMKRLTGMKQKTVVLYANMHSVAAAARRFTIPRTTIGHWMVDGYFKREVTKRGVKKGARRPLTYSTGIDE